MSEKPKKILFLITKSNFGGAQRYVHDLASSLPRALFEPVVGAGGSGSLLTKLEEKGVRTIHIKTLERDVNPLLDLTTFFQLLKIIKAEKPDILHLNSSKIGALGALAGRCAGIKKIIFTGHGWAFNEERRILSKFIIGFIHWTTIMLCHRTIAVSYRTSEQIKKIPFVSKKIYVIHNGLGPVEFLPKEEARAGLLHTNHKLEQAYRERNPVWIGTISELHMNKGLDYVIRALGKLKKTLPDFIFTIIGEGEERDNITAMIQKYSLEENVFMLGFVERASSYLKAFDIFTLTSRTEAFPYVILEAAYAERPIVATYVGGIPEVITDMENGILIKKRNPKEIEEAIRYYVDHPEKREIFSRLLKEKVEREFTLERMVNATMRLYI